MNPRRLFTIAVLAATLAAGGASASSHHVGHTTSFHGGISHGHFHSGFRPHIGFRWGLGWWPAWSLGLNWGWPYYGGAYYGGPYGGYSGNYRAEQAGMGALDMDVSPERAEVYVDGEKVGICDDFDGYPDYLWLPQGSYDIVIYLPGYKTIARQMDIYPGQVIEVDDEMEKGESIRPEDLKSTSTVRRDERHRQQQEVLDDLHRRPREPNPPGAQEAVSEDARAEPGRLHLDVKPDDASVYLDGRFLGSGRELSRLRSGLIVDPGAHTLEIVRPGFADERRNFSVASGEEASVSVELQKR